MNDRGIDAIVAELKAASDANETEKVAVLLAELKALFEDKDKSVRSEKGFEWLEATMETMVENTETKTESLDRETFSLQVEFYNDVARDVAEMGYKKALRMIRDRDVEKSKPYMTSEELEAVESLNEDELRRLKEREKDLVNAIEQGMTLQEYLESDSAHSWLDRQQAEGDEA